MHNNSAQSKRSDLEAQNVQGYDLLHTEEERDQVLTEINARVYDRLKFLVKSQIIKDQSESGLKAFLTTLNRNNLDASDLIEDIQAQKTIFTIVSKGSDLMARTKQLQDRLVKMVAVLGKNLSTSRARLMLDKYTILNDKAVGCLKHEFDELERKIQPCIFDQEPSTTVGRLSCARLRSATFGREGFARSRSDPLCHTARTLETTSLDFNMQYDAGLEDIEMQLARRGDRICLRFAEKILESLYEVYRKTSMSYASKANFELMDASAYEAADREAAIRLSAFRYVFLPFVALQRLLNKKRCQDRFLQLKEAHQRYKEHSLKLQKYYEEFQALVKSSNQKSQFHGKELQAVADNMINQNFSDVFLKLEDIKSRLMKNHMQGERTRTAKNKNNNSQAAQRILFFSLLGQTDLLQGRKDIQDCTHQCQTLLSKCDEMLDLLRQIGSFYLEYVQSKHQFEQAVNWSENTEKQCLDQTTQEVMHVITREKDKIHIERVESTRKNLDEFALGLFKQSFLCQLQIKEFQAVLDAVRLSRTNLQQVLEIELYSKEVARDKASRVMKKVYTWAHLEADEDLKQAFQKDALQSKNLAVKLKTLNSHFDKLAAKLKKHKRKSFLKECLDVQHKSWRQNWQFMSMGKDYAFLRIIVKKVLMARLQDFTEQEIYSNRKLPIQNAFTPFSGTRLSVAFDPTTIKFREVFPPKNIFDRGHCSREIQSALPLVPGQKVEIAILRQL